MWGKIVKNMNVNIELECDGVCDGERSKLITFPDPSPRSDSCLLIA